MSVVLVTDSTAALPPEWVARDGIRIVPVQIVIDGVAYDEDSLDPAVLTAALEQGAPVSTSKPSPERLLAVYRAAAEAGATAIVSAHICADMSGTVDAARVAALRAPVPVDVIDSRTTAMALGYAVQSGAVCAATGGDGNAVADVVRRVCADARVFFYVDTLEYLRRGGRMSAGQALVGQALAVKPLLGIVNGQITAVEKVRTRAKALSRLTHLALDHAATVTGRVRVAVHHLGAPERATDLATEVGAALGSRLAEPPLVTSIGAAVGAHVGPGMVAIVVASTPNP